MLSVWGGIHRRGARQGRGGGAVGGSNAQTLLSCHCNQPESGSERGEKVNVMRGEIASEKVKVKGEK